MAEKDETIAELRKLVDELQSLMANLEETLRELRRQLFGTASEKTISIEKNTAEAYLPEEKASKSYRLPGINAAQPSISIFRCLYHV